MYTYTSSFGDWKEEASFLAKSLEKNFGIGWAVPYDARIGLQLHPWALGIGDAEDKVKAKVEDLATFNRNLHSIDSRIFSILDYDPWTESLLKYDFGKLKSATENSQESAGERKTGWATRDNTWWDVHWNDQNCDVIKSE